MFSFKNTVCEAQPCAESLCGTETDQAPRSRTLNVALWGRWALREENRRTGQRFWRWSHKGFVTWREKDKTGVRKDSYVCGLSLWGCGVSSVILRSHFACFQLSFSPCPTVCHLGMEGRSGNAIRGYYCLFGEVLKYKNWNDKQSIPPSPHCGFLFHTQQIF